MPKLEACIASFHALGVEWKMKLRVNNARITELQTVWCAMPGAEEVAGLALATDDWRVVQALKPFIAAPNQVDALEIASLSFGALPGVPAVSMMRSAAEALLAIARGRVLLTPEARS